MPVHTHIVGPGLCGVDVAPKLMLGDQDHLGRYSWSYNMAWHDPDASRAGEPNYRDIGIKLDKDRKTAGR